MFKKDETLTLSVLEGGAEHIYCNCLVLRYEDGLLKVRLGDGKEVIYNVHSANFIKAERQED